MMSISTQSNQSPSGNYARNGSNIPVEPLSGLHSEEPLPQAALTVHNLLVRTTQDVKDNADALLPRIGGGHVMKRAFRDFFIRETVHIFDFLSKPIDTNPVLSKATEIVKRFGRTDYNIKKSGIRDLCIDTDCHSVLDSLQISLQTVGQSSDPLGQWILQTKQILDQWRLATIHMACVEKQLEQCCSVFDDILKKAKAILELPSTMSGLSDDGPSNPYTNLVIATEQYIKKMYDENCIEDSFDEYCRTLKKVSLLTDAMGTIRSWVNVSNEPLCSICITEPISMAYVPCGHTFCKGCGQRQSLTCHVCRTAIREKQKIYFS